MRRSIVILFFVLTAPAGAQGRITGTVYDSLITNAPLAQATVVVVGTNLFRVTDARGRFQIDSLPAGRVQLTFFHPVLDSIGFGAGLWHLDVPVTTALEAQLGTPSGETLRHTLCPDLSETTSAGLVMGRVRDVDRRSPIAGARVSTNWLEVMFGPGGAASERFEASTTSLSSGVFALCGVPLDVPLFVRASMGDQASGPVEIFASSKPVVFQDLSISLTDSSSRLSVDSALNAATVEEPARIPGSASLTGHIEDVNGRPVRGARVALHGGGVVAVADHEGAFRLSQLPAGTQSFDIRAIGYSVARRSFDLVSNASTTVTWTLDRRAAQLPTVTVLGGSRLERNGFTARARQGHGYYLTEAKIAAMGGALAMDVIERAPGLLPLYRNLGGRQVRVVTVRSSGRDRCIPALFVDGGLWIEGWEQFGNFLMKADIVGVEVYPSTLAIPPQFDRHNGCGSVVVWTRP